MLLLSSPSPAAPRRRSSSSSGPRANEISSSNCLFSLIYGFSKQKETETRNNVFPPFRIPPFLLSRGPWRSSPRWRWSSGRPASWHPEQQPALPPLPPPNNNNNKKKKTTNNDTNDDNTIDNNNNNDDDDNNT